MNRGPTLLRFVFPIAFALLVWFNFFITREGITVLGGSEALLESVPVMVLHEPPMRLLADVSPDEVTVRLSGDAARLQAVRPEDIRAFVSVENGLEAGTYEIFLQVLPPKGVSVISIVPAKVTVRLLATSEAPRLRPGVGAEGAPAGADLPEQ